MKNKTRHEISVTFCLQPLFSGPSWLIELPIFNGTWVLSTAHVMVEGPNTDL